MEPISIKIALNQLIKIIKSNPLFIIFAIIILTYLSLIIVIKSKKIKTILISILFVIYLIAILYFNHDILTFIVKSFYRPNAYINLILFYILGIYITFSIFYSKHKLIKILNSFLLIIHLCLNTSYIYYLLINNNPDIYANNDLYSLLFLSHALSLLILFINIIILIISKILNNNFRDEGVEVLDV